MGLTRFFDKAAILGRITIVSYPAGVDLSHEITKHPRDRAPGKVVFRGKNLVTSQGKSVAAGVFGQYSNYVGAQYLAIGSGTGSNLDGTGLYTEVFRKAITGVFLTSNTVDCSTFILAGEANFVWTELGLFGNGASGTAGSGTMLTHATISLTGGSKANTQQYTVDYNVTIG